MHKCPKCNHAKPERCHHCSVCKACVLKYDHHCPYIGTCVGFRNQKFFILFLIYALITCAYMSLTGLCYLILEIASSERHFKLSTLCHISNLVIGLLFASASTTMLSLHIGLVCRNETTLGRSSNHYFSCQETRECNVYDLGNRENIKNVFGDNILLAMLPIFTSKGNGIDWPKNTLGTNNDSKPLINETI